MLLLLTGVMGYELKTAVGTSVFIMTFTALTGSVSHFAIGGAPQWLPFFLCIIFTFGFAQLAARIANRASAKTLNGRYSRHSRRRDPGFFAAGIVVYKNNTAIGSRCFFLITIYDIAISERFSSGQRAGR